MSINPKQLREFVIRPALSDPNIALWSPEAEDLLLGTACQESSCGRYLHQIRGPAVGIYQMEPATYNDLWAWCIARGWREKIQRACSIQMASQPPSEWLAWNLRFATLMTRLYYLRRPGAVPSTLQGQAAYWKEHYNTHLGKGTPEQYVANWKKYAEAKDG